MKILFQGDSVTDAGRDRNDYHDLGAGYAKFAAAMIADAFQNTDFEFINLGISSNRTSHLVERLQFDFIDIAPDLVILLIGVNDVWHHYDAKNVQTTAEQFHANLRTVLDGIRSTGAKLVMLEPYMMYGSGKDFMYEELDEKIRIERALAHEYADAYIPLHALFAAETVSTPYTAFSPDGVHPNAEGAAVIAQKVFDAAAPLVEKILEERTREN